MKLPKGRGILFATLACALCLSWGLGPVAAQESPTSGVYGREGDNPPNLGPKPKPLRRTYAEPEAAPAAPKPGNIKRRGTATKSTKAKPSKKASAPSAGSVKASQTIKPKLAKEPKPKPRPAKQARPAKAAKPKPRATAAGPVKISTRQVQQALNRAGYPSPVDGKLGKKTRQALRHFQRAHNLPVTGQADRATLVKLGLI